MSELPLIYVVDDTRAVVDLVCRYVQSTGEFESRGFLTTEELLAEFAPDKVDCILSDLKMPVLDGEGLYKEIIERDPFVSFVFISGVADVKTAVRLMEQGAVTLLEKPFTLEQIVAAVRRGAERTQKLRAERAKEREAASRLDSLTAEELQVLDCVVAGLPNKTIAARLALSPRTVDRRRQSILQKMSVDSVAQLAAVISMVRREE